MRIDANIKAVFDRFDVNQSGRLDYRELRTCLHALGLDVTRREAAEVLLSYDSDANGLMELLEFARLVCAANPSPNPNPSPALSLFLTPTLALPLTLNPHPNPNQAGAQAGVPPTAARAAAWPSATRGAGRLRQVRSKETPLACDAHTHRSLSTLHPPPSTPTSALPLPLPLP